MPFTVLSPPSNRRLPAVQPRLVGWWLGGAAIAAALLQRQAEPGWWVALVLNATLWPLLSYRLVRRASSPVEAERQHVLADSLFGGWWTATIGFNLLPSILMLTSLSMHTVAVGGPRRLLASWSALAAGAGAYIVVLPVAFTPHTNWATLLACIPGLVLLPLMSSSSAHQLALRLVHERGLLERSHQLARETLDAMQAGIVLYDPQDRLLLCNDDFRHLYGPIAHLLAPGMTFEQLLTEAVQAGLVPEARGCEQAWIAQRLQAHRKPGAPVLRELPDGRWRRIVERRLSDGSLLAFSTDVTDLVQREQRLQQEVAARQAAEVQLREANLNLALLSNTDHLTGLANRRQFEQCLEREWKRAARQGTPLSALMMDVDHFKAFNDRHGHLQGDDCLKAVAEVLRTCARRAGDVLARFGGEEFVLLLPGATRKEAFQVAQQCLDAVDARAVPHGAPPGGDLVSVSIGCATCIPDGHERPASLLDLADTALYRAKRLGRHRVASVDDPSAEASLPT